MDSLTASSHKPCACKLCTKDGFNRKQIHRAWVEQSREEQRQLRNRLALEDIDVEDIDVEVDRHWHLYAPHLSDVEHRMPYRARHLTYNAKETFALRKLRQWHDRTGEFAELEYDETFIVVLSGPPGTGKTVAAVWLAIHRLAIEDPRLITAADLARTPRYGAERSELLESTTLIIDDLGTERADDKFVADFDEIVDRIYQSCGGMLVITTNCTAKQFERRYGARVVDRFAEVGTWIPVVGKSMRTRRTR